MTTPSPYDEGVRPLIPALEVVEEEEEEQQEDLFSRYGRCCKKKQKNSQTAENGMLGWVGTVRSLSLPMSVSSSLPCAEECVCRMHACSRQNVAVLSHVASVG